MRDLWLFFSLYRRHSGLLMLGILLAIVTVLASLSLLALSGWFITATAIAGLVAATAQAFNFFTPGAGVRGFSITRTAARYFERLVSHDATFKLLSWLRSWFFEKLMPISLTRLQGFRKGELLNRLVADVDALDQLYLRLLSPLVAAILVALVLALGMSFFSQNLARVTLMVMGAWLVLLPTVFYGMGNRSGQLLGEQQSLLRQQSLDYLQAMAESLIYGSVESTRASLEQAEQNLHGTQGRMAKLEGLGSALLILAAGSAALLILYLGSQELLAGQISGPVMVMCVFAVLAGFEALMPLPGAFQFLGHTRQAAGRLREVIEQPPVEYPSDSQERVNSYQKLDVSGQITFSDVSFSYPDADRILNLINLTVQAGQKVALLGKTGCGKSTLIRLLTRQLEPSRGDVLLDGKPVSMYPESDLYSAIAVVPQKTHVFSATLRDNLKLAAPDADDSQLLKVVAETGLDTLAAADGAVLDLWLGQGGIALSGGEQRRLAIARAMLKMSPVLVMDEPGEGLDVVSEQTLLGKILDRYQQRTVVFITHKTAMLARMDAIYRMDSGQLTLQGEEA